MTPQPTLSNDLFVPNRREAEHRPSTQWRRPARARTSPFDPPASTPLLGDTSLRDPSWRKAERHDLYALAALAFGLSSLALGAAVVASQH